MIAQEFNILGSSNPKEYWDSSVLAGLYTKGKAGFASIGPGLALSGDHKIVANTSNLDSFVTVGLPVEAQLFLTLPFVGIGWVGFANFTPEGSYWGGGLALQFGNLR